MADKEIAEVDMSEVKAEDIIGERQALYNSFMTATMWGIGIVVVTLVLMAVFLV
ncbi:MAG TPA: aa3-type cytochrome c oxidase subunit IV [Acetobacteraceae bacterium]|jgi:hypothetical protein|nr:aa3-type cytochrome c oxidase subunit IV [Acetobacteraceae bacterium]